MSTYPVPQPGSRWRHFKGNEYEVIGNGLEERDLGERVIYRSLHDGTIWLRPPSSFFGAVTLKDGEVVQRFVPCDAPDPLAATNAE